jgi:hypothetical protein
MAQKELCVSLDDPVDKDECLLIWRERNPDKQNDIEVVSVNEAGSKLEEMKPTKLTLILARYETTVEFVNLWSKFEKIHYLLLTKPLLTLHFIFLVENLAEILKVLSFKRLGFFKDLQCETIEFDCKFTVSLNSGWNKAFLNSFGEDRGLRVNLGSTTTSVTVRCPGARIIQLQNGNPSKFNLVKIHLITERYPMGIILCNVNPDAISDKNLNVYWNNKGPKILQLKDYNTSVKGIICIKLNQPALSNVKSTQPASLDCCSIFDCCLGGGIDDDFVL